MNYRHDFHAGNFADVFKHVVLTRILLYLQKKLSPFRLIDTHAGSGRYDLAGGSAARTQEWKAGIGRLEPAALSAAARNLVQPYLDIIGTAPEGSAPYPGSPAIAVALVRKFDRMIFCELHPAAVAALTACVGRDRRAKVVLLDGYTGLNAFIPPVERRGLILIDPPFEAEDEFARLTRAVLAAHAKWREGIIMVWHPIKSRNGVEHLVAALAKAAVQDVLRLEFHVGSAIAEGPLAACGLILVNPPYTLEGEMACLLPELQRQLGQGRGTFRIDRLSPERSHHE